MLHRKLVVVQGFQLGFAFHVFDQDELFWQQCDFSSSHLERRLFCALNSDGSDEFFGCKLSQKSSGSMPCPSVRSLPTVPSRHLPSGFFPPHPMFHCPHPCFQETAALRVSFPERQIKRSFDVQIDGLVVFFEDNSIIYHIVVEAGWRRVPQHPLHNAKDFNFTTQCLKILFSCITKENSEIHS